MEVKFENEKLAIDYDDLEDVDVGKIIKCEEDEDDAGLYYVITDEDKNAKVACMDIRDGELMYLEEHIKCRVVSGFVTISDPLRKGGE